MDFRTGIHEAHTKAVALRDSTASPFNPDTQRQLYYRVQLPPVTQADMTSITSYSQNATLRHMAKKLPCVIVPLFPHTNNVTMSTSKNYHLETTSAESSVA